MSKIIISIIVSTLCFLSMYTYASDYEYSVYKAESFEVSSPTEYSFEEIGKKMKSDLANFKKINPDVVAVIDIPGVCYQPVVFTGDHFYLRKGIDKKYKLAGTLFLGKYTEGKFDDSAIIYGHHMHDGTMFASLKLYNQEVFFKSNEPIKVYDGKYLKFYKPYTSLIVRDGGEKIYSGIKSSEKRKEVYGDLYNRSTVKMEDGLSPNYDADMLFLQTCEYVYNGSRHLVGAYLVREDEV